MVFDKKGGPAQSLQAISLVDIARLLRPVTDRLMVATGIEEERNPRAPPDATKRGYARLIQQRGRDCDDVSPEIYATGEIAESKQEGGTRHFAINVEIGLKQKSNPVNAYLQQCMPGATIERRDQHAAVDIEFDFPGRIGRAGEHQGLKRVDPRIQRMPVRPFEKVSVNDLRNGAHLAQDIPGRSECFKRILQLRACLNLVHWNQRHAQPIA